MKLRWNINEELNKNKEEKKVSSESKFTTNYKGFNIPELNKERETASKQFPLFERGKRTHDQLQENSNFFGLKNPSEQQNAAFHPLKLLNKNENLTDSKKMNLIEKDFEDLSRKNLSDLNWAQNQEKLNLNFPEEETSKKFFANFIKFKN